MTASSLFWLSSHPWRVLNYVLAVGRSCPPRYDDRPILGSIIHTLRSGCLWRDCRRAYDSARGLRGAVLKHQLPFDPAACRSRNLIERMFCRLKDYRRIATRYDKLADNYLSALCLAAVITGWVIEFSRWVSRPKGRGRSCARYRSRAALLPSCSAPR